MYECEMSRTIRLHRCQAKTTRFSDVVVFPRFGCEPGSRMLYSLEFGKKVVGNVVQQAVSVVKARRNVRMNHNLCYFPIEKV